MIIECTAHAPRRAVGLAFMQACGIGEERDGVIAPLIEVQITSTDDGWQVGTWMGEGEAATFTPRAGWFVNVRYYGATAEALTAGLDQTAADRFERTRILDIVDQRTGEPMQWVALSDDPVPPGYENADGVRLYDPALIATRACVWA